jgi:hypothetical protein
MARPGHPFRNGTLLSDGHGMDCRVKPGNDDRGLAQLACSRTPKDDA